MTTEKASLAPSADVRFPDLGTKGKNARRMRGSVVDLTSSHDSGGLNDKARSALSLCRNEWVLSLRKGYGCVR